MATINFRTAFKWLVPSWMSEGEGELLLGTITILIDGQLQHVRDALEARFPSYAGPSALQLIGQDRGILRGRTEDQAHYAERLRRWRYPRGHRTRGSAFAFLEQLSEYWGGLHCWTVDAQATLHDRSDSGHETYSYDSIWDWDGTPASPRWGRFWAVLDVSAAPAIRPWPAVLGAYGNSLAPGRGLTIGQQGVTPDDCRAVKNLLRGKHPWKPAGTIGEWLIVSFDGAPPFPDGTWGRWSGRNPAFRFWSLHDFR